ncbi:MAG: ATP-binding protein, partial [Anaerolineae bacterium]|nr:ATP-binding protein [Anaerolineae bacterium]
GWIRPEAVLPASESQRTAVLHNLHWLDHQDWGPSQEIAELRHLRHLVTAQEAVGLFHLPLMPQAGQTSALSTADVPFVIPPEVVSTKRFDPGETLINLGYLYQRNRWLGPEEVGEANAVPFQVRLSDLEKPSLLVGAPGSGKSNLALYILQQLGELDVPFLVLDPSTGHEYRYLYAADALKDRLIVYTTGDEDGFPFRFNPFAVPPGVTVRAHITRLLSCFKAAYEMWDPLPAIYEAALARVYMQAPFGWTLDEKGPLAADRPFPCLSDFAQAVIAQVEENVLPDYGKGTEAGGILTGASKIRVNGILNSLGRVLNVRQDNPQFFQTLLQQPVVIELGALGDPSSLALVMAFLVTQLVGHIEYAYQERNANDKPHLLLIDEAHRLLSAETSATTGQNQGNTRGKSAEEMNTMLAEVRKFRQGIMILDQRPSSLVGGVLDNALINIMCRLNDRGGFEHLSHVLNLSPAQQRYARTRLRAGQTLTLDATSGQPVLLRAPLMVETLRDQCPAPEVELQKMREHARGVGMVCPEVVTTQVAKRPAAGTVVIGSVWTELSSMLDEKIVTDVAQAVDHQNWAVVHNRIRDWLLQHRRELNPLLEATVFAQIVQDMRLPDVEVLVNEFCVS